MSWAFLLVLLTWILILGHHPHRFFCCQAADAEQDPHREDSLSRKVVVLITVDGTIVGVSKETGKVIWTNEDSLAPTVSTTSTTTYASSPSHKETTTAASSSSWNTHTIAIPALDGTVYLSKRNAQPTGGPAASASSTGTSMLTTSSTTSFSTKTHIQDLIHQSPFWVDGNVVYNSDRSTSVIGIDLRTGQTVLPSNHHFQAPPKSTENANNDTTLWLGITKYQVSIFDVKTMVRDASFSITEFQGKNEWFTMLVDHNKVSSSLLATPNGYAAFRENHQIQWVIEQPFSTPVAFAMDASTGATLPIDLIPDPVLMDQSTDYISQEMERQLTIHNYKQEHPLIGSLPQSGQLYGLPLGRWEHYSERKSNNEDNDNPDSDALTRAFLQGQYYHAQNSIESSLAAQQKTQKKQQQHLAPQLVSGGRHSLLSLSAKHQNQHSNPLLPSSSLLFENRIRDNEDRAIVPFYHPDYGYVPPHFYTPPKPNPFQRALWFLGTWLPAAFAFFFFLSFELGRRKRDKSREELRSESPESVGLIQIEDEVLGYGGHGTIVYRGKLEGRQVAVKRMLKTYLASADREISLLIESDGHPNVVRYFLKEVRGDFVYLALELCDLSLHSLISQLQSTPLNSASFLPAMKSTLFQIACGIRHLHSLRIVHRDLKPANILLADVSPKKEMETVEPADVTDVFVQHGYVAKISDMGLGKQLVGQSSFGAFSTLDQSLRGQNEGQASFVGNGPGSVGWQAPEVMAQRLSSDVSMQSDGSNIAANGIGNNTGHSDRLEHMTLRTSRSVDVFSLGCVFYSSLVPGSHPFGQWFEREANIMHGRFDLSELEPISPDACHLISLMLERNPSLRPTVSQVCEHPFFWDSNRRLDFVCSLSDRIEATEGEDHNPWRKDRIFLERSAAVVVGQSWDTLLDSDFLQDLQKFRGYDFSSVRDLLRLIRNKSHHFDELPESLKQKMNHSMEGLLTYFEEIFPKLVIHCYSFCQEYLTKEDMLVVKFSIYLQKDKVDREHFTIEDPLGEETKEILIEERNACGEVDCTEEEAVLVDSPFCSLENTEHPDKDESEFMESPDTDVVVWCGGAAAREFGCRGWNRSDDEWIRGVERASRKTCRSLIRCAGDPKFRTRLCNHWDMSFGTYCPILRKNKCVFAHGPVELRVKEGKKKRWGKLTDKNGNNNNPRHSGGEDTYGAARSIETERKQEGKWKVEKSANTNGSEI